MALSYDIAAMADNQPTVYVRWGMGTTDSSVAFCGWNIDDVTFTGAYVPLPGDFNDDGDVDLDDYAVFYDCMGGPDATPDPTPPITEEECRDVFDFDTDNDVDVEDFAEFQSVFSAEE